MSVYIFNGICESAFYLACIVAIIPLSAAIAGYFCAKTEEVKRRGSDRSDDP